MTPALMKDAVRNPHAAAKNKYLSTTSSSSSSAADEKEKTLNSNSASAFINPQPCGTCMLYQRELGHPGHRTCCL